MLEPKTQFQISTPFFILLGIALLFSSCTGDSNDKNSEGTFVIAVQSDPEKLHPYFNPKTKAREIFQNIFLPLADFHPDSKELIPILLTKIPDGQITGDTISFECKLIDGATWQDGTPITANDVEFAVRVLKHPDTQTPAWKPYMEAIYDLKSLDSTTFIAQCNKEFMLAKETVLSLYPLPKHLYNKAEVFDGIDMSLMSDSEAMKSLADSTPAIDTFLRGFNAPGSFRSNLMHAGPYQLKKWVSDQYVTLIKTKNFWAEEGTDNPYLQTGADTITFKIIKDEMALATLMKDGGAHMTSYLDADQYLDIKQDSTINERFDYREPESMSMVFIGLNNRSPKLNDVRVRKALASVLDVSGLIEAEEKGMAKQLVAPIHPSKPYYPHDLNPIKKDIAKAKELIKAAGWSDTNNDGIVDKNIDGRKVELVIDLFITGSDLSKALALLLKDGANDAGFDINIIQKSARIYIGENVTNYDYEMAAMSRSFDSADDDPYTEWHSESAINKGRNRSGLTNTKVDSLIEIIRTTSQAKDREKPYTELTRILAEEMPVLPLFVPKARVLVDSNYDGVVSSKRPGYMPNTFRKK